MVGSNGGVGDGCFSRVSWEEMLDEEREGVGEDCIVDVKLVMMTGIVSSIMVSSPPVGRDAGRPQDVVGLR